MFARIMSWLLGRRSGSPKASTTLVAVTNEMVASPTSVTDGARYLMLSSRLASVAKLNTLAGRKPRRNIAVDCNAPAVPSSRIGARKQRASSRGRRIATAGALPTAQIIAFPQARRLGRSVIATRKAA